jgi:hypothetical protein
MLTEQGLENIYNSSIIYYMTNFPLTNPKNLSIWLEGNGWKRVDTTSPGESLFCLEYTDEAKQNWIVTVDIWDFPVVSISTGLCGNSGVGRSVVYNLVDQDNQVEFFIETEALAMLTRGKGEAVN